MAPNPKKLGPSIWNQVFVGVVGTVLATVLIGGVTFANAMENRTQALEATSKAQAQTIRDQRQKIKSIDQRLGRMDRMLTFLATKAGYVPAEMGAPENAR